MATEKAKKRVLHVEDDKRWQEMVRDCLDEHYQVTSYSNLPGAKQAAATQEFDYFICDGQILGEDGTEWAEELHGKGKKVMILSGYSTRKGIPTLNKGESDEKKLRRMLKSL